MDKALSGTLRAHFTELRALLQQSVDIADAVSKELEPATDLTAEVQSCLVVEHSNRFRQLLKRSLKVNQRILRKVPQLSTNKLEKKSTVPSGGVIAIKQSKKTKKGETKPIDDDEAVVHRNGTDEKSEAVIAPKKTGQKAALPTDVDEEVSSGATSSTSSTTSSGDSSDDTDDECSETSSKLGNINIRLERLPSNLDHLMKKYNIKAIRNTKGELISTQDLETYQLKQKQRESGQRKPGAVTRDKEAKG